MRSPSLSARRSFKRWIVATCLLVAVALGASLALGGWTGSTSRSSQVGVATRLAARTVASGNPKPSPNPVRRPGRHGRLAVPFSSSTPDTAQLLGAAPHEPTGWVTAAHTVVVDGVSRSYLSVQPATLNAPVPVVVLLHGRFMTADQILGYTRLAFASGPAVIIAPQGYDRSWDADGCCGPAWRRAVNDVAFVSAALDQTFASTPMADRSRVYAAGFSNGGRLAYLLACDMPGVLRGFAAVEAVPVVACPSMHPLDITVVAQQNDPLLTVSPNGAPKRIYAKIEPTVPVELSRLRALDGCAAQGRTVHVGVSVLTTWTCASSSTLRYVWYPGGGHSWRAATPTTPGATAAVVSMLAGQVVRQ